MCVCVCVCVCVFVCVCGLSSIFIQIRVISYLFEYSKP